LRSSIEGSVCISIIASSALSTLRGSEKPDELNRFAVTAAQGPRQSLSGGGREVRSD
jgi:hypothetical protein